MPHRDPTMRSRELGEGLRQAMQDAGLNGKQTARLLDVTPGYASLLLSGKRGAMSEGWRLAGVWRRGWWWGVWLGWWSLQDRPVVIVGGRRRVAGAAGPWPGFGQVVGDRWGLGAVGLAQRAGPHDSRLVTHIWWVGSRPRALVRSAADGLDRREAGALLISNVNPCH
ncbi:MAG: hypothetical protein ACRDRP_22065 [Pseudonocardiaceae bacterium]